MVTMSALLKDDTAYDDASIVSDFHSRYASGGREPVKPAAMKKFRTIIYGYFRAHGRDFPWRHTDDPYHILVSEIMLQQTQTGRVAEKFVEFIGSFPTVEALAGATLLEVMAAWQGMGYNRRARYLHELAARLAASHGGRVPDSPGELALLPGIGAATAASICAFAFNRPVVFIETNIRTVFIHFFFHDRAGVGDREILPLVEAALDRDNAREWYSALMDYGVMLKKRHANPSRKSAHHQKQKPFEGSRRQLRGQVLRALLANPGVTVKVLCAVMDRPEEAVAPVIDELVREGLVRKKKGRLRI
jgi:A/G-specific adenine glycosylase